MPRSVCGSTSSRRWWTRVSVARSCGDVAGMAVRTAVSPEGLTTGWDTKTMPSVADSAAARRAVVVPRGAVDDDRQRDR